MPAVLMVNGEDAALTTVVNAGDHISFTPARSGADAARTLGELLGKGYSGRVLVNNRDVPLDTPLCSGDVILTLERGGSHGEQMEEAEAVLPLSDPLPPTPSSVPAETPAAVPPSPPPTVEETPPPAPVKPVETPRGVQLILNGAPLILPEKESGQPYYLMDLLERSGLDFDHLEGPVRLTVNGRESGFSQSVRSGDVVTIRCD